MGGKEVARVEEGIGWMAGLRVTPYIEGEGGRDLGCDATHLPRKHVTVGPMYFRLYENTKLRREEEAVPSYTNLIHITSNRELSVTHNIIFEYKKV